MQIKKYRSDLLILCYVWDFKLISNVKGTQLYSGYVFMYHNYFLIEQ